MSDLPKDFLYLLRNNVAKFKCAPLVYKKIIEWAWDKDSQETIGHYIQRNALLDKMFEKVKTQKDWTFKNSKRLSQNNLDDFDVTFLHELLPIVCYGKILMPGTKGYENKLKDLTSVEYFLKQIKEKRNDISHEEVKARDPKLIEKLQKLINACIQSAGVLYGKNQNEIDMKKEDINNEFHKIIDDTTNSHEKRVKFITEIIMTDSISSLEDIAEKYMQCQPLPSCCTSQIDLHKSFHSLNLVKRNINTLKKEKILTVSHSDILNNTLENFTIISGIPGSGKTTLIRCLFSDHVKRYQSLLNYPNDEKLFLPLYVECRTENSMTLEDFWKRTITAMPVLLKMFQKEEIFDAIESVEGFIFFIDGYDEINSESKQLVNSIISFCRKRDGAKCIISGRVKSAYDIEYELGRRAIKYTHISIEPIEESDDQIEFLESYSKLIDPNKTESVKRSFLQMNKRARAVFNSPILLSLFYSMFSEETFGDISVCNDVDVNEAIVSYFKNEIEMKIENEKTFTAAKIIDVISEYCLHLFINGKYYLLEEDFIELAQLCKEKCPNISNIEIILDCVLTPQYSLKSNRKTRHFIHSTIQEYFAVKGLILKLVRTVKFPGEISPKNKKITSLTHKFSQIIGSTVEMDHTTILKLLGFIPNEMNLQHKLHRFENIMRLLILSQARTSNSKRFVKPIGEFMQRHMKLDERLWFDMLSAVDGNEGVLKIAGYVLQETGWRIHEKDLKAASRLFQHVQPRSCTSIKLLSSLSEIDKTNLGELLTAIKQFYRGDIDIEFNYSHSNYEPLDNCLAKLRDSKCCIRSLTVCITSGETLSILRGILKDAKLNISFPSSSIPNIINLNGCGARHMQFFIKYVDFVQKSVSSIPEMDLTKSFGLTITDIPSHGYSQTLDIIQRISPNTKLFRWVHLMSCGMGDEEVVRLSNELYDQGFKLEKRWGSGVWKDCIYHLPTFFLLQDAGGNSGPFGIYMTRHKDS